MNTILILILCIIILLCINFDKNNNIEHFTTENTQNEYEEPPTNLEDTCSSFTSFKNSLSLAISQNERIISPKIEELELEFTQLDEDYSDQYSIDDDGLCLAEIEKKEFYEKNTIELNKLKTRIQRVLAEIDDYKKTASSNLATYNSTKNIYLNTIKSVLPEDPGNELSNTSHNSVKNKFTSINDKLTTINNTIIYNNELKTAINSIINENQELNNLGSIRTDIEGEIIHSNEFLYSFDRTSSQNIIDNIEKDDLMYERVNNLCLGSGVVSYPDGGGSGGYCNKSDYGCTYTCSSYNTEGECISDPKGSNTFSVSYNSFQNILGDSVKIHSHIHRHDNMNEEALGSAHPH
tara:strand:+ start:1292 stop:2341 length:1050 start_codon:yes stop_codon:yes gene_type:complete